MQGCEYLLPASCVPLGKWHSLSVPFPPLSCEWAVVPASWCWTGACLAPTGTLWRPDTSTAIPGRGEPGTESAGPPAQPPQPQRPTLPTMWTEPHQSLAHITCVAEIYELFGQKVGQKFHDEQKVLVLLLLSCDIDSLTPQVILWIHLQQSEAGFIQVHGFGLEKK